MKSLESEVEQIFFVLVGFQNQMMKVNHPFHFDIKRSLLCISFVLFFTAVRVSTKKPVEEVVQDFLFLPNFVRTSQNIQKESI